jgi:hypothetical protein
MPPPELKITFDPKRNLAVLHAISRGEPYPDFIVNGTSHPYFASLNAAWAEYLEWQADLKMAVTIKSNWRNKTVERHRVKELVGWTLTFNSDNDAILFKLRWL